MTLDKLIEILEEIRDEYGGLIDVEEACDGSLLDPEDVLVVDFDGTKVVEIG